MRRLPAGRVSSVRACGALLAFSVPGLLGVGCGGAYYGAVAFSAAGRLSDARGLGAETSATYEYTYAKAHLDQAATAAAEGHYDDALRFAETADGFALIAWERAREANAVYRAEHSVSP